jgi:hypothetical protein
VAGRYSIASGLSVLGMIRRSLRYQEALAEHRRSSSGSCALITSVGESLFLAGVGHEVSK